MSFRRKPRKRRIIDESGIPKSLRKWLTCRKCKDLAAWRRSVVIGRGDLPCQVLFIGEAPGKTEDALGEPFVGMAGRILSEGIVAAARMADVDVPSIYVTNLLACRPADEEMGDNRPPRGPEVGHCMPRLARIVALARPEKVVLLGEVPAREARRLCPDGVKIRHPAYVARKGGFRSVDYRIFVRGLADVFGKL